MSFVAYLIYPIPKFSILSSKGLLGATEDNFGIHIYTAGDMPRRFLIDREKNKICAIY